VSDALAHRLTGRLATDHTLAIRTGSYLLPGLARRLRARSTTNLWLLPGWRRQHAHSLSPGASVGAVTADAARFVGLTGKIPVVIAGHDYAVAAWSAGAREPGQVTNSVGTAEVLLRVASAGIDREAARIAGMSLARATDGDSESLIAGSTTAGADRVDLRRAASRNRPHRGLPGRPSSPVERTGYLALPHLRGRQCPLYRRR